MGESPKLHWHQLIKGKRDTAERRGLCLKPHSSNQGLEPFLQNLQEEVPTEPEKLRAGESTR